MYENNNGYYQPNQGTVPPQQPYQPYVAADPEVEACVESAFSKGLAATIMSGFPVASIIAISFGSTAVNLAERAKYIATQRGTRPGGKNSAANILGKVGKYVGIAMTIFWGVYLLLLFSIIILGSL